MPLEWTADQYDSGYSAVLAPALAVHVARLPEGEWRAHVFGAEIGLYVDAASAREAAERTARMRLMEAMAVLTAARRTDVAADGGCPNGTDG